MANVLLKKSSVGNNTPGTGDLAYGEVAINYADGRLYYKNSSNVIKNFVDSDLIDTKIGNTIQSYDPNLTSFLSTFDLPTSDGSADQVLTTDGSGNLSFSTSSTTDLQTLTTYRYTATSGQTTYEDSDENSLVLDYTAGAIVVALNGVLLIPGDDYTATDGTSVVLTNTPTVDDELQIIAFSSFAIADAISSFSGTGTVNGISLSGTVNSGGGGLTLGGTLNGVVTSFSGTGTVNGISLSGTVDSSGGGLTLGGTLSGITSSNFAAVESLIIYNSSGTALKTIYSTTT